ncbi:MAG TPA: hypothetical protein VGR26_12440 [Acidimicrobiales bacterium]|nr:hypothetical protein [Acidimicrobiales bacterium]
MDDLNLEVERGALAVGLFVGVTVWTAFVVGGWELDWPALKPTGVVTAVIVLLGVVLVLATGRRFRGALTPIGIFGGVAVALIILCWITSEASVATLAVVTLAAWITLASVVAREWGRGWVRAVVAIVVVVALVLTVKVGREQVDKERTRESRALATTLERKRADLLQEAEAGAGNAAKDAARVMDAAGDAVAHALEVGQQDNGLPVCPTSTATADERLCKALQLIAAKEPNLSFARRRVTAARQESGGDLALRDRIDLTAQAIAAVEARGEADKVAKEAEEQGAVTATAINFLCARAGGNPEGGQAVAGGASTPPAPSVCTEGTGAGGSPDEVADATAAAEAAVAELVVAVRGRGDGRGAALDAAQAAARAAESSTVEPEAAELADLVAEGADALVRALTVIGGQRVPVALAVAGWALLGLLALLAYRRLEIANARIESGSVTIGELQGAGPAKEDMQAAWQRYVLQNVPEPGDLPGTSSSAALSSLTEASSDATSKLAVAVLKLVHDATASTSGYLVDATYHLLPKSNTAGTNEEEDNDTATDPNVGVKAETEATGEHEIFARVRDARTGATLSQRANRAATQDLALRKAGYWAAAVVLERGRRVPSWARWSPTSSEALAAYDEAEHRGGGSNEALVVAAREAPTSGLLLLRLANQKEIEGARLDALELTLRACTVHPRYPQARYRLSVSFAMIAGTLETSWATASPATKRRLMASMRRCATACGVKADDDIDSLDAALNADGQRDKLLDLADKFRKSTDSLLRWPTIATNALRRSERSVWLPMLIHGSGRRRRADARQTMEAAGHAVQAYRTGGQPAITATNKRFTAWQARYNMACAHAIAGSTGGIGPRKQAVAFLEQVLEAPGGAQLSREWLLADPDLTSIRGDVGFIEVCARVRERERIGGTAS